MAENPTFTAHPRDKLFKVSTLLSGDYLACKEIERNVFVCHNDYQPFFILRVYYSTL